MDIRNYKGRYYRVVVPCRKKVITYNGGHPVTTIRIVPAYFPISMYSQDDKFRYSFEEAVEILKIFSRRWVESSLPPDPTVEPYAEEMVPDHHYTRRIVTFTLFQIHPWTLRDGRHDDVDIHNPSAADHLQDDRAVSDELE